MYMYIHLQCCVIILKWAYFSVNFSIFLYCLAIIWWSSSFTLKMNFRMFYPYRFTYTPFLQVYQFIYPLRINQVSHWVYGRFFCGNVALDNLNFLSLVFVLMKWLQNLSLQDIHFHDCILQKQLNYWNKRKNIQVLG